MRSLLIEVTGVVQGVGFRPFVYRAAKEYGISGTVANTPGGVVIEARGGGDSIFLFLKALREGAPPAALVDEVRVSSAAPSSATGFEIVPSTDDGDRQVLISPDLATCRDCLLELFDEGDRRYRYPFINCTNCGPRFTIMAATPYDRPATSMASFEMCGLCRSEYEDPANRRFHAQPNACAACGPRAWMTDASGSPVEGEAAALAAGELRDGKIVAIKGLGGFHLACDATNDEVVEELRRRKKRYGKPLAVMARSMEEIRRLCEVSEEEEFLLSSPRSPIVLLREIPGSKLSRGVAGGLDRQGVFLPYTPLQHLVLADCGIPLVMTSGNVSSEPIATRNDEAIERLAGIADCFLVHDRDILVRYDDSVTRVFAGGEYPVRRARGYAPYPLRLGNRAARQVLALGAELKNTFCVLRGDQAFMGQHIGDMESAGEVGHFEEALEAVLRLFSLRPEVVAHDLHPEYLTTLMAEEFGLPRIGVQHHHAHIVSCLADNAASGKVIGVAWDGTGYGTDGTVWGGEFLVCDEGGFERVAHLRGYPMPGADACIFKLYRMAMGVMSGLFEEEEGAALERLRRLFDVGDVEAGSMALQIEQGVNAPLTSSAGRMFDTAAALAGLRSEAQYDGQAACELEAVAVETGERYDFFLETGSRPWVVDTRPLFLELLGDVEEGRDPGEIAGKFHTTMALVLVETCERIARDTGLERVALSGGVFQNELLSGRAVQGLERSGLEPLLHRRVPCNDGGISLGQAVIADRLME